MHYKIPITSNYRNRWPTGKGKLSGEDYLNHVLSNIKKVARKQKLYIVQYEEDERFAYITLGDRS